MSGTTADRAFWEWMDAYVDEPHNSQYEVPDMQRAFEAGQAAIAAQQPQPDRSLLALVDAHFVGNGPYPLQLVCWTEDASDVECDTEIAEVEPGVTWDELEARIVAHAAECHAAARAQTSLTLPDTTPQPAPMVRLTPCPAEGHDGAHIQWNSSGHWLCGQQVADALGTQGIFADRPAPQPAPELAADDVHVDWHMTSEEWRQLAAVLALRPDLPYVRALIDAGKVPAFGSEPTATVKPAPGLAAAMAETRQLRTALRTLADLWDASSDKDEETARRPNRAYLVLEERATVRRACAADIRKLAGPEGK